MKRKYWLSAATLAQILALAGVLGEACTSGDEPSPTGQNQAGSIEGGSAGVSSPTGAGGTATMGSGGTSSGSGGSDVGSSGGAAGGSGSAAAGSAGSGGGRAGAGGSGGRAGAGGSGGTGVGGSGGAGGAGGNATAPTPAQLLAVVQTCANVVSAHKYATDDNGSATIDICALNGAVFWKADMDIDCDGRNVGDGKCPGNDCCYQPQTAFTNKNGQPLAASVTPYVVIPNDFKYTGLRGGTVVAVIYSGKLQYAVFGDTGPNNIIGEASYACAANLGINPDPGNGGTGSGVTYIAFTGTGTVPADIEDQAATKALGEKLAAQLLQNP